MDGFQVGAQMSVVTDDVILSVNGGILTTHGKRHTAHGKMGKAFLTFFNKGVPGVSTELHCFD
jgi:hypothetical protein